MSTFQPRRLRCGDCGTIRSCAVAVSVDAAQQPAYRNEMFIARLRMTPFVDVQRFWSTPSSSEQRVG